MTTRADLIIATLKLLNAIAAGQDPEPEDVEEIDNIIDAKVLELNERGLYWTSDTEEFEGQYVDPLSIILANTAAPSFAQPRNPNSQLSAEAVLRQLKPSTYVAGSTLAVDYF